MTDLVFPECRCRSGNPLLVPEEILLIQPDCSLIHNFWNFWGFGIFWIFHFEVLGFFRQNKLLGLSFVCWIGGGRNGLFSQTIFSRLCRSLTIQVSNHEMYTEKLRVANLTGWHHSGAVCVHSFIFQSSHSPSFRFSTFTENHTWRSKSTRRFCPLKYLVF